MIVFSVATYLEILKLVLNFVKIRLAYTSLNFFFMKDSGSFVILFE